MANMRAVAKRIPRAAWVLVVVQCVLLALLLFSLQQWMGLSSRETKRANSSQQRIIIDPVTGAIAGLDVVDPDAPAFEVVEEEETPEPPAPEPTKPPEATPPEAETPAPTSPEPVIPETLESGDLQLTPTPVRIAAVGRSEASLEAAPAAEVHDAETDLPKRGPGGASPALVYARPFRWEREKANPPTIAILVTGLGLEARAADAALKLPPGVTLSFSPYGKDSREWAAYARNLGHEVWLDLPAQTKGFPTADPGPMGIFKGLSPESTVARLREAMKLFPGYVGMVLPPEQTLLPEPGVIMPVIEELRMRGLLMVTPTSSLSLESLPHLAEAKGDLLLADILADRTGSAAFIGAQLRKAEERAQSGATPLVVLQAHPLSLRLLSEWAASLKDRHIVLVPVSALTSKPR